MTYTVAVRELCEFTAKQGDLDLRFTPAPTALEGIAGHAMVAERRGKGYRAEVALAGQYKTLRVRGRADGVDTAQQRLDEVKTFKGRLDRQPASHRALHWAQARIYGWLLCQQVHVPRHLPAAPADVSGWPGGSQRAATPRSAGSWPGGPCGWIAAGLTSCSAVGS